MFRLVAAALTATALLSACGPSSNFITGEQNEELNAPLPSTSAEMRQQLRQVSETLASSTTSPTGGRTDARAVACARLFDLADELRYRGARYDLTDASYELVADANRACDERPREAASDLEEALSS